MPFYFFDPSLISPEILEAYASIFGDPPAFSPSDPKTLALQRLPDEHLGYGTFGKNLASGLNNTGVSVHESPNDDLTQVPKDYRTVVRAALPWSTRGCWQGQFVVLYTMWEADHLPPLMQENLHNFDMIVVPNDQNRDLFSEYHDNVAKVPLGYNSNIWSKLTRPLPEQEFNFLWCGAGKPEAARKGSDLAIRGFQLAFPNRESMWPKPRLLLKTLTPDACVLPANVSREPYDLLGGIWDLHKLVNLYQRAHAMVMPSRGEGWGYHPQQAVATGMPTILSQIPGHTEYSWLPGFYEVPVTRSKASTFIQGDPGMWWEPDLDALIEGYRSVYENYEKWVIDAETGSEGMSSQFSHRKMANRLCKAIGGENLVKTETGPWQEFSLRKYQTTANRDLECSISDVRYNWRAGVPQWAPANARQVLEDAGYLQHGLSENAIIDTCAHRPGMVTA